MRRKGQAKILTEFYVLSLCLIAYSSMCNASEISALQQVTVTSYPICFNGPCFVAARGVEEPEYQSSYSLSQFTFPPLMSIGTANASLTRFS